jgi:HK97 family phage major capsid protein
MREREQKLRDRIRRTEDAIKDVQARQATDPSPGLKEREENLTRGLEATKKEIEELKEERRAELGERIRNREVDFEEGASFRDVGGGLQDRRISTENRDAALRRIETFNVAGDLSGRAAEVLDHVVRDPRDQHEVGARYLEAVGDPAYFSAFGKMITDPTSGHLRFSAREVEAVRTVTGLMYERSMSLTGAAGGFAVPFQLDPSIMLTSSGALNPIRQLARVITVSVDTWKGVSSTGVTAAYQAEAAAVTDASPTLAQPTIDVAMGRAFVPFSIELGMDWGSLQQELLQLIADGRDVLDATKFLTGTGTDEPAGVLTGLTTSQRVQSATTNVIAIADIYSLKGALPARWIPTAIWAMHPNRADSVFRLTPAGSTTEPQAMPTRDGPLAGKRLVEWTTMATAATTTTKWALYGDFRAAFTIADRIGMTVELIPHLFGAAQGALPTGQRGLFCYWRTGSKVVVPEALRYGEVL